MLAGLIESGREAQRAGAWDEALVHYEAAFSRLTAEGNAACATELLRWIGTVYRERGSLELAGEAYEASLAIAEANGLGRQVAAALNALASVEHLRGDFDLAASLYSRARDLAESTHDEHLAAIVDLNLGILANIRGDVPGAVMTYRSALARYRRLGDDLAAAQALNNIGMASVDLADWPAAEDSFREALDFAHRAQNRLMVGTVALNHAELHLRRQQYERARESCGQALTIFHQIRSKSAVAEAHKLYGILYRETGQSSRADTHFALSLGMAEVCQDRLLQAEAHMEWALLHLEEGRRKEGIRYLNRALRLFTELQAGREVLDIEQRLDRFERLYLPAVEGWAAEVSECKDPHQAGHSRRVADYACMLAREVGYAGRDLTWLRVGALVHDMGNVALPAEVLSKADLLRGEERELMQAHTIMGDAMVGQMDFPPEVRPIVRNHHEQWAGTGYPDRLRGEAIPRSARIVCVADVYDALTSARSFRPAFSQDEALGILQSHSGSMLDPGLVEVFCALVEKRAASPCAD